LSQKDIDMRFVVMAEWDLARHHTTMEDLRAWAHGPGATAYRGLPGVFLKSWYSNPQEGIWGAVYLVEDPQALNPDRLPRTVGDHTGPIGTPPDRVRWNIMEDTVLGGSALTTALGHDPTHAEAHQAPLPTADGPR
jgi:hypothetical protein